MVKLMQCTILLGTLLAASASLHAADTDAISERIKAIEGTWDVVARIRDGQPEPEDGYEGARLILKADTFIVRRGDEVLHAGTFKIVDIVDRVSKSEIAFLQGPYAGQKSKQIGHLGTKMMTVCSAPFDGAWPKEFASTAATKSSLTVYRRARP